MRARDIAEDYPTVGLDDDALAATRLIAQQQLDAVVVVDDKGKPIAVLPGSQVLNFMIPQYVRRRQGEARRHRALLRPRGAGWSGRRWDGGRRRR